MKFGIETKIRFSSISRKIKIVGCSMLAAATINFTSCIDQPFLPTTIAEKQCVSETIIIEVEGECNGYETGAAWIICYEDEVAKYAKLLGPGSGPDGMASTDSRPCLRYEVQERFINEFIALIVKCACETGMEKVYFNEQTGLVNGEPEFDCLYFWED